MVNQQRKTNNNRRRTGKPAPRQRTQPRSFNYQRRAPTAIATTSKRSARHKITYKESERIASVLGSATYAVATPVVCQPGVVASFPWLSAHAALYEKYKVVAIKYTYTPIKGTDSPGQILMSFDYDAKDEPPTSSIQQTQSTVYATGSVWAPLSLVVPMNRSELYTRNGPAPAGTDIKTYDSGTLFVGAEGCLDTSIHGYLEVAYIIDLMDKQPNPMIAARNTPPGLQAVTVIRGGPQGTVFGGSDSVTTNPFSAVVSGDTMTLSDLVIDNTYIISTVLVSDMGTSALPLNPCQWLGDGLVPIPNEEIYSGFLTENNNQSLATDWALQIQHFTATATSVSLQQRDAQNGVNAGTVTFAQFTLPSNTLSTIHE